MTPREAIDLLARAAQQVMTIAQSEHYNAAVKALGALIDASEKKPDPETSPKDA